MLSNTVFLYTYLLYFWMPTYWPIVLKMSVNLCSLNKQPTIRIFLILGQCLCVIEKDRSRYQGTLNPHHQTGQISIVVNERDIQEELTISCTENVVFPSLVYSSFVLFYYASDWQRDGLSACSRFSRPCLSGGSGCLPAAGTAVLRQPAETCHVRLLLWSRPHALVTRGERVY